MYDKICNFAKLKGLSIKPNRKPAKILCYVCIDSNGIYIGLDVVDKKPVPSKLIPDFGSHVSGKNSANAIVEKSATIFDVNTLKHKSYMEVMERGIDSSVSLCAIHTFLLNYETDSMLYDRVQDDLKSYEVKDTDTVSFSVDGTFVEDMEDDWNDWLLEQVAAFSGKLDTPLIISSISGELQESVPADNGPVIQNVTDGKTRAAFGLGYPCSFAGAYAQSCWSYGFSGGIGLQLGKEDANNFAAGIEYLLSNKEYHNDNFHLIYFYDKEVDNIIMDSLQISDDDLFILEDDVTAHKPVLSKILSAVISGQMPQFPNDDAEYYMACFSGANRRYYLSHAINGHYADLVKNLYHWYYDTSIETGYGQKCIQNFYNIFVQYVSKLSGTKDDKKPKNDKNIFEAIEKEFSDVKFDLLNAIYQNKQIPYILYDKAIYRAMKCASIFKDNEFLQKICVYVQIIKCYLLRKGYEIMSEVNCNVSPAYACGKLFAAYEQIQWFYYNRDNSNRGNVNKNLVQSYFAAVMKQPGVIFPKIAELGTVYFNKLTDGSKSYFTDVFGEISAEIGSTFPAVFSDVDKGAFVLGYYQQKAAFKKRNTDKKLSTDIDVEKENEDE